MITSKQRSKLISIAMNIPTLVQIGKNGVSEQALSQISELLDNREIVKVGVLRSAEVEAKDIIGEVAVKLGAEAVQAIGSKMVLYRLSEKEGVEHIVI